MMKIGQWRKRLTPQSRNPAAAAAAAAVLRQERAEAEAKAEAMDTDGSCTSEKHRNITEGDGKAKEVSSSEKKTEAGAVEVEGVAVHDGMANATKALEVAEEEEVADTKATIGDMEVILRAIKPCPIISSPSPPQHTDMAGVTSVRSIDALGRGGVGSIAIDAQRSDDLASSEDIEERGQVHNSFHVRALPIKDQSTVEMWPQLMQYPSLRSPTSQFEYDIMDATHQTLDIESLQKSYSLALLDDDDKTISSEDSLLKGNVAESHNKFQSDCGSEFVGKIFKGDDFGDGCEDTGCSDFIDDTMKMKGKDAGCSEFVEYVLSPMMSVADSMFCQLESAFPEAVEDVNEILSTDLHHLVFEGEGEAEAMGVLSDEPEVNRGDEEDEQVESRVEVALAGGEVYEQEEDEEADEVLVADGQKDSEDVEVVLGRWVVMQGNIENYSYSPAAGFVLRKDIRLPELSEEEVLIRVDATTISSRDCFERLRRDSNRGELIRELWVPGHEIVGHVVQTGRNANFLLDKRIAALLPYGGGCSQYICLHAKNTIPVPEEASSNEMVTLLSTYVAAYQCLESVFGIEAKEEDSIDSEGEEDDESIGEFDIESKEEDDTESKKETDVEVEPKEEKDSTPQEAEDVESEKEGDVDEEEDKDIVELEEMSMIRDDAGQKRTSFAGKAVLIVGADNPVGLALVDLAKSGGASVYTVSQSSHFNAILWRGGMDLIVDTVGDSNINPSFYTEVLKTRGRLVRLNITSCGKKYSYMPRGKHDLTSKGRYFGASADIKDVMYGYFERVINDKAIDYDIFHSFKDDKELFTEDLAYLHDLLQVGKIDPKIFSRVGFDELEGEWEKIMKGDNDGVVVVTPWKLGFTRIRY